MNRLYFVLSVLLLVLSGAAEADISRDWITFKDRFIAGDGRVIDYVNNKISSSEGQSYAMIMAVEMNDHSTFDLVWNWTVHNLQVRGRDSLMAWKWGERATGEWDVIDHNNAADGDTFIALALLKAAEQWGRDDYKAEALAIMDDIREKLVVEKWGKLFLLPGYYGFIREDSFILNPSYLLLSAYKQFARHSHNDFWNRLYNDSLSVIENSFFGRYNLPADWLVKDKEGQRIYEERSEHFGYESIRVLLYLSWDNNTSVLNRLEPYLDFVESIGYLPCCVNLSEDTISMHEATGGFYAVLARAAGDYGRKEQSRFFMKKAVEKIKHEKDDYYSNILYLLSKINIAP